jgi:hypothetical protein
MSKALSIVGSSRNNGDRQEDDFYPTPSWAVKSLLNRVDFKDCDIIWECACGDGAISKTLESEGFRVKSSDIVDRGYEKTEFIDFLDNPDVMVDAIITNPPYKYALEFVEMCKKKTNKRFAMFLKTVFLESERRYNMFQDTEYPLKTVYQFSKRVSLYKDGVKMKNSGMIAYAWYVWEKGYEGKPTLEWINDDEEKINNFKRGLF